VSRVPGGRARRARRRLGQHFLEPPWAEKVVRAIGPRPDDLFIEIGPGRGALTLTLAASVRHVLAVEIDRDLASDLASLRVPGVTVLPADVLAVTGEQLIAALREAGPDGLRTIRIAGNLPYNVASPILFRLCELYAARVPITDATVMLQREVADRLVAPPGSREYGVLSVLIGIMAEVERLMELPPGAFRPPPKVRSTVVRLRFHPPDPRPDHFAQFSALVRDVFTRRRKTLANALLAHGHLTPDAVLAALQAAGIEGQRRPETLSIEEFVRLSDTLSSRA
jgi:16S rRNA (adenine1518-N6/adenine1519-N6)-dimethyltransferase